MLPLAASSSIAPLLGAIIVALLGSGGIGYFIDRRSSRAGALAKEAADATQTFTEALNEERFQRKQLQEHLAAAQAQLTTATTQIEMNTVLIATLREQIAELERTIRQESLRALREVSRIVSQLLQNGQGKEQDLLRDRYRAVIEAVDVSAVQVDRTGTILYASVAAEALLGYDPDELAGLPLTVIVPERYRAKHLAAFKNAVETGQGTILNSGKAVQLEARRKDGSEIPIALVLGAGEATFTATLREWDPRNP